MALRNAMSRIHPAPCERRITKGNGSDLVRKVVGRNRCCGDPATSWKCGMCSGPTAMEARGEKGGVMAARKSMTDLLRYEPETGKANPNHRQMPTTRSDHKPATAG